MGRSCVTRESESDQDRGTWIAGNGTKIRIYFRLKLPLKDRGGITAYIFHGFRPTSS